MIGSTFIGAGCLTGVLGYDMVNIGCFCVCVFFFGFMAPRVRGVHLFPCFFCIAPGGQKRRRRVFSANAPGMTVNTSGRLVLSANS